MELSQVVKGTILGLALLLATGAVAANKGSLNVQEPITVSGQQLAAGQYNVSWEGSGSNVQVNILQGKKVVAKASGRVVDLSQSPNYDSAVVKKNADYFKANMNQNVLITGNCDERGTNEYNMALGQRRADAAAKFLMGLGVGKDRIGTVSYGEEKPLCMEHNEDCWSKNRRDDFVVVKP